MSNDTLVDVIVATRNRPEDMARLLPTTVVQSHRHFRFFAIDQSDDPEPNRAAIRGLDDARFRHLVQREKGKSRALNLGLSRSSAELVAFTDDDCTLPEDWLATAVRLMLEHPDVGILFGNLTPTPHDPERCFIPAIEFDRPRVHRGPLLWSRGLLGMGANMIIRRSVFDTIGLFDEDLGPGGPHLTGEEVEITYRALQHGFEVQQRPELRVVHWGARPLAGGVAKQLINSGYFAVGSGYGKHLRSGDVRTVGVVMHELAWVLSLTTRALLTNQRPLHIRRLGLLSRGIVAGLRRGLRAPVLAEHA
jgi:glycosyltransferase involved in cell wall biosynthesis